MTVPFQDLAPARARQRQGIEARLARVLDHGQFILGPEVGELEQALASRWAAHAVVTCASGSDALALALHAAGVEAGDGVLVPALSFIASAEAITRVGARPIFCDVDPSGYIVTPACAEAALARARVRPRITALLGVDLFGVPTASPDLVAFCEQNQLTLISDAAQSLGARVGDAPAAGRTLSATSFFPAKPLGCYGDGGAVFCQTEEQAQVVRQLRVHGQGPTKYESARLGYNSRLDTLQAAVLLEKLEHFDAELERRNELARRYSEALAGLPGLQVPQVPAGLHSAWAQYTIVLEAPHDRNEVKAALAEVGITTRIYYPTPLHHQRAFSNRESIGAEPVEAVSLPTTERLCQRVLSLPLYPDLAPEAQGRVIAALGALVA